MKFRLRHSKKKAAITGAFVLLISGGIIGAASFFGYLPNPMSDHAETDVGSKSEDEDKTSEVDKEHLDSSKKTEAESEGHPPEEIKEGHLPADHGQGEQHADAGAGQDAAHAPPVEVTYEIPVRSDLVEAVKQLLEVQTDAAFGRKGRFGTQRDAIEKVQAKLTLLDGKKATRQEFEVLAVYLLSGGNPRGLSEIIKDAPPEYHIGHLLTGVRAFVVGDIEKAQEHLPQLDARSYPPVLASRLFMAQAALIPPGKVKDQQHALELAASLAPGTLVEEAAYRRLLLAAVSSSNVKLFSHFADRYIRRFPNSAYVSEFVTTFQNGVLAFEEARQPVPRRVLRRVIEALPPDISGSLLTRLGQHAVESGHTNLCKFVAGDEFKAKHQVDKLSNPMRLYWLACRVVAEPEEVLPQLEGLSQQDFDRRDAGILSDAIRLAKALIGQNKTENNNRFSGPALPDDSTAALMVSATQQLSDSQALIEEALK